MTDTTTKTTSVDAKIVKAMSSWTSKDKGRYSISHVFIIGGALYATDSYRAIRVRPSKPIDAPDGTMIAHELFRRMDAKDCFVNFSPECTMIGHASIPYADVMAHLPEMDTVIDSKPKKCDCDFGYNPDYISDICKIAKAAGKGARLSIDPSDMLRARVRNISGVQIDMVVMPVRL